MLQTREDVVSWLPLPHRSWVGRSVLRATPGSAGRTFRPELCARSEQSANLGLLLPFPSAPVCVGFLHPRTRRLGQTRAFAVLAERSPRVWRCDVPLPMRGCHCGQRHVDSGRANVGMPVKRPVSRYASSPSRGRPGQRSCRRSSCAAKHGQKSCEPSFGPH